MRTKTHASEKPAQRSARNGGYGGYGEGPRHHLLLGVWFCPVAHRRAVARRMEGRLIDVTNSSGGVTPRHPKPRGGKGSSGARDLPKVSSSGARTPDSSDSFVSTLDEFSTPAQHLSRVWTSPPSEPASSKSAANQLVGLLREQLYQAETEAHAARDEADARAAQIQQLHAVLAQQQRAASGCEDELRSEVAAMQQIATERECSRIRLMHEIEDAVKIANLGVQEADGERSVRERVEDELRAERQRNEAAEQRLQRELEASRTNTQPSSEMADLEKREAALEATLAQVHLRETAVDAQRVEIQRQREALTEQQAEVRAALAALDEEKGRRNNELDRQEELQELRTLRADIECRARLVHQRELDIEEREATVATVEENLRSGATKLRAFAHEQSLSISSSSSCPSCLSGRTTQDTTAELTRREAQVQHRAGLLHKREEWVRQRETELVQANERAAMQSGETTIWTCRTKSA